MTDPEFRPHLAAVLAAQERVVKESTAKRVTQLELRGTPYYCKRYRYGAIWRSLKYLFKTSPARQEWELARQLAERGIPVVRHVALGERWDASGLRESILITEAFPGLPLYAVPDIDPSLVLSFVSRMHDCGVLQDDLHPGNILVSHDRRELRLVDLHGIRIKSELTGRDRALNLAYVRIFIPIPVSDEIRCLSQRMRRQEFSHRSRRCFRLNRDFEPCRAGGLRWQVRPRLLPPALVPILENPDAALVDPLRLLKHGRSSTVGRLNGVVLKRYNLRKRGNLLKDLFRRSRAFRAFRKAYHLELVGIPTARPIAVGEKRTLGIVTRSYLVMEEIPGAKSAHQLSGRNRQALQAAAELVARMHEEGFMHRDLKTTNLLFDDSGKPHLIDLEGLQFIGPVSDDRAARDLSRLTAGALEWAKELSRPQRLRFLKHYCQCRRRTDWLWWWRTIERMIT